MSLSSTVAKVLVGGAAVAALSGIAPAFADAGENLYSVTTGASAWSDREKDGKYLGNAVASVKDKVEDGDEVFVKYDRRYNTGFRMNNEGGVGSTLDSAADKINYVTKVQACVNLNNKPDRCGSTDQPGDGR
ncbi:hypothetical protein GT034_09425 [Streptomyces sp. SID2563]|uniref:hypothetical protein n=1 Tax=Streptomyces sp. SID2563 TaxID=2690255 RepID=UPI0013681054|nr:hypothetical protein [Streptomyces sp. SID2563]MYW08563.1 hypothetical protein [Streptomyces sp. SID2563]